MVTVGKVNGDMMVNEGTVYGDMIMNKHSQKEDFYYPVAGSFITFSTGRPLSIHKL